MYFLQWYCHSKQNSLIVAKTIKGVIDTFEEALNRYPDAEPQRMIEGQWEDLPVGFVERQRAGLLKQNIDCFATYVCDMLEDFEERNGPQNCLNPCTLCSPIDRDTCVCHGTIKMPKSGTWEELYERRKDKSLFSSE